MLDTCQTIFPGLTCQVGWALDTGSLNLSVRQTLIKNNLDRQTDRQTDTDIDR